MDVFNWEGVKGDGAAVAALGDTLAAAPACLVEPPAGLSAAPCAANATVLLAWVTGPDTAALFLDVSTTPATAPSGALAAPDVAVRVNVTGAVSALLRIAPSLAGAPLWASVVAAGCGGGQAVASPALRFAAPARAP